MDSVGRSYTLLYIYMVKFAETHLYNLVYLNHMGLMDKERERVSSGGFEYWY